MARKQWLINGYRNSQYFHQTMKSSQTVCKITKIKDNLRMWIDEAIHVESMFLNGFTIRFKSNLFNIRCYVIKYQIILYNTLTF